MGFLHTLLLRNGITTLGFVSCDLESYKALCYLRKRSQLPTRVRIHLSQHALAEMKAKEMVVGLGDSWLKIIGVKILVDGSLGARTAWLSFPYVDNPDNFGAPRISEGQLEEIVRSADESGLQVAAHGIGDRAIDRILDAYEKSGDVKRNRHRIEHCSIIRSDQIQRMSEMGITATVQPHFVITDWWVLDRIGRGRAQLAYPFKTLRRNGVQFGLSTDCPVEPLNPWETIYAAITRGENEGVPLSKNTPNEKLSLEETLHSYTYGSAYVLNEENEIGTLEPGKLADFIIIDLDPFSVGAERIRHIKTLEVYVGGIREYHVQ